MGLGKVLLVAVLGLGLVSQLEATCSYATTNSVRFLDTEEAQEITDVVVPKNIAGVSIRIQQYIVGNTKYNDFLVEVHHNFGGLLPTITRDTSALVDINIDTFLRFIPSASPTLGVNSLLTAGALQMMAYHLEDRCILPALSASLLLGRYAGVHAQSGCASVVVDIYTPHNKCFQETSTGYILSECPATPTPPTQYPTYSPTVFPTTATPTSAFPTRAPTKYTPTESPTDTPTLFPTVAPTLNPTSSPSTSPPTVSPTKNPTRSPTLQPTQSCFEASQSVPCNSVSHCYEASFGQVVIDEVLASDLDPLSKNLSILFLQATTCHAKEDIPSFCMFLDAPSCVNAVNDGFCGNTDMFTLPSLAHLATYPRPVINCYPAVNTNLCESITDQPTCEATVDPFFGFNRECTWLNLVGGGTLCRSATNLQKSDCPATTVADCDLLAPVCQVIGGSCQVICEGFSEAECNNNTICQYLTDTSTGGYCSLPMLFEGDQCSTLDEASCNAAQATDFTASLDATQDACRWDGSSCSAVRLLELGEESAQAQCHPGHSTLDLLGRRGVPIREVKVGDSVKSAVGYEPVIAIIHASENINAVYYKFSGDGFSMEISKGHVMYVNGELADPKDVRVGDYIQTTAGERRVDEISLRAASSAYHIYTRSGTYYADGVLVSDKHGLASESWGPVTDGLFSLWKSFAYLRYAIGAPIVNDDKVVWFGEVMRMVDSLPLFAKLPVGCVVGPAAFVYGNLVTINPVVLTGFVAVAALWQTKSK